MKNRTMLNNEGLPSLATQKDIVHLGLQIQANFNTVCAIEFFKSYNIDSNVIQSILLLEHSAAEDADPRSLKKSNTYSFSAQ